MKKMIIALGLFLALGAGTVKAETGIVTPRVMQSFKQDFANATEINWEAGKNFYRASFTIDGQKVFAYYSTEGVLMSVGRYISTRQLPFRLFTKLKNQYAKYWISDLFEVNGNTGTSYYVTLENAENKMVLNADNGSNWSMFSKSRKS